MTSIITTTKITIALTLLIFILKFSAYLLTNSMAFYSDALESIVNVITSTVAFFAIRLSLKPADSDHHYGHHKAEYFSVIIEAIFIFIAALMIFHQAYQRYFFLATIHLSILGLIIHGLSMLLTFHWSNHLLRVSKETQTIALEADARHLMADAYTSVAVALGFLLSNFTGYLWIDLMIGLCLGAQLVHISIKLLAEAVDGLMDRAPDLSELNKIKCVLFDIIDRDIQFYDLKVRKAGKAIFVEFRIIIPEALTLKEALHLSERIKQSFQKVYPSSIIIIHPELKQTVIEN